MFYLFMGLVMLASILLGFELFGKWDYFIMYAFFAFGIIVLIIKKIKKGKG